eukprot:TRINITY_DN55105_c0_g1_i1.p1 TRINITY_DN55105_c0_g1~~TRINITY_DN55105_c0_g1_i1.p1  ORF type:complete len:175 (+),score=55.76 TRINITY_DN55105_c0_g1_i1:78-527(+)
MRRAAAAVTRRSGLQWRVPDSARRYSRQGAKPGTDPAGQRHAQPVPTASAGGGGGGEDSGGRRVHPAAGAGNAWLLTGGLIAAVTVGWIILGSFLRPVKQVPPPLYRPTQQQQPPATIEWNSGDTELPTHGEGGQPGEELSDRAEVVRF